MFDDFNDPEAEDLEIISKLNNLEMITENIYSHNSNTQNFCHFNIGGKVFLIWARKDFYLEIFELVNRILLYAIKAHDDSINSVHHFYDAKEKRNLIITTSDDKFLKIWNFEDFSMILKIENDTIGKFRNGFIFAEKEKNLKDSTDIKYYIISELSDYVIAFYDFKGKFIRKIQNCLFFDLWHCPILNSCHLLGSYAGTVKLFELNSGKLTKEFKCNGNLAEAAIINDLLITADVEGYLRTYNIHDNSLMNQVKVDSRVTCITIWDIEYFFIFLANGYINCYEAKTLTNVKIIKPICEQIVYAESLMYPSFGPALVLTGPINSDKAILSVITSEPHLKSSS